MEEQERTKFEYSPEKESAKKISPNRVGEVAEEIFGKSENLFDPSMDADTEPEKQTRASGNSKTLLQTMQEGTIHKELLSGSGKDMLDDSEIKEAHQNTIG